MRTNEGTCICRDGLFGLKSASGGRSKGKFLSASAEGKLSLSFGLSESCRFRLEGTDNCISFPEAELNVDIKDGDGLPVDPSMAMARPAVGEPIVGFADVHVHLNHFLASGQTTFVGETFNPLGIQEALRDCSLLHCKNGSMSWAWFRTATQLITPTDGLHSHSGPRLTHRPISRHITAG
jgi:hypothetical protein